jgi:uncharacterized UPF0160 family protein
MLDDGTYTIVTHCGNFHTDEIMAVAVLKLVLTDKPVKIIRTRDTEVIKKADFAVDIGGENDPERNRFDHHQKGGAGERPNSIPYSSFGLVWKQYGSQLCGSPEAAEIVEERLVWPVDAADSGVPTYQNVIADLNPYILHNITEIFRPTWKESAQTHTMDDAFADALELYSKIIVREIRRAHDNLDGERFVEESYEHAIDRQLVVLDGNYPWHRVLSKKPEPLYVVKPDAGNGGRWKVSAVRTNEETFQNRKDLPKHWAGRAGGALIKATGVHDAIFCHDKLFIAVAGSKDGAIALARLAIDYSEEKNGYANNGEN